MQTYTFHIYLDAAYRWRWRLVAPNNRIIAASGEAFYSKEDARRSALLVQAAAGNASVV